MHRRRCFTQAAPGFVLSCRFEDWVTIKGWIGEIGDVTACAYLEVELSDSSLDPSVRLTIITVLGDIGLR